MATTKMPWYEFAPNTYEIDEFDCGSIFLLVGQERALLIDTGSGIGDLKALVEKLTDKPYDVVITHSHGDHTGGLGWFDKYYISSADLKDREALLAANSPEGRARYAAIIAKREHKNYPYDPETDIRPWPAVPEAIAIEDGHVFDLGGRTVTAYLCPGHTVGELVLIDDGTRILFAGDACNCNLGLGNAAVSIETAGRALQRIWDMRDRYDFVYNSHHDYRGFGAPLADDVLPNAVACCHELVAGTANIVEVPEPMDPSSGRTRRVAMRGTTMVSFRPDNILDK